ncbi:MAG: 50S ribosomal protein L21 [Persephonella sp.]|nr:MAG: 50S ribosomal protein L21 [Persephonella sp.]RUM62088.1 MAG: 50S ribosomal protein L21 [Persephonella sp.]
MYAIIETGGKQYKVKTGDKIKVEKLNANEGEQIELKTLLVRDENGEIKTEGKTVAEVKEHGKHKKVIVFKFKRKKNYKRWRGHRQPYTLIEIKEIKA